MISRLALALTAAGLTTLAASSAAQAPALDQASDPRASLTRAVNDQRLAAARAGKLEAAAAQVGARADRTAQEAAALAARIQQAEAGIAAGEARLVLLDRRRAALRASLAQRQQPLVRLTGALQLMSRRPLALSVLRPGSLSDTVHLRAVLDTMLPEVRRRTAGVRGELLRARQLREAVARAQAGLRADQVHLSERRRALAGLEARQRLESRAARGEANREADRALALAEQARDLSALMGALEQAGALRRQLAALPGPVLRPNQPGAAQVAPAATWAVPTPGAKLAYILPVTGRIVSGFGESSSGGGLRSQGITIAAQSGAQVVAPAVGRVAFAGSYQGYGRIVIIEHDGGWTTLITGLAATTAMVGERVVQGAPLGVARPANPRVTIELRKDGAPIDVVGAVSAR